MITLADIPALRALARRCWPKERHRSRGAAEAHRRSMLRRGLVKDAIRIDVYECAICGDWHVGHRKYVVRF